MRKISISDITIKQSGKKSGYTLSFREKLETAKLLEKINVNVIELSPVENVKADTLLIKSVCSAVKKTIIAVPVGLDINNIEIIADALKHAKKPRLQVHVPVSDAQMEYIACKKPAAMVQLVADLVSECKKKFDDVEFIANDATRSNMEFLTSVIKTAIDNGATTVTLCDTAGVFLASEFSAFIEEVYLNVPRLKSVQLGVDCSDTLSLADTSVITGIMSGADVIKVSVNKGIVANLSDVVGIISHKKEIIGADCDIKVNNMKRIVEQIKWMCDSNGSVNYGLNSNIQGDDETFLNAHDDESSVAKASSLLGYDLSAEDITKVYEEFRKIAQKKETVGVKELDAIIASVALQVPPTYRVDSYLINSGNTISATSHMKISKNGVATEGISIGDGPIDASFIAIEQIIGQHFELDDFQIKSITEGREAMGEAIVKLRSEGKLYSGRGISTDILGASINAYMNAINKIVYEQNEN